MCHRFSPDPCTGCLLDELQSLVDIEDDPVGLCHAAKQFGQWKTLARLVRPNNSQDKRSTWASLWHYVGRLSCWFGKCEALISTARQFPQLLENAKCAFLPLPKDIKIPVENKSGASLEAALKRMLPADQQDQVRRLYDQLAGLRLFDIPLKFFDNFSDEKLMGRVHAEVFLMEHFHLNEFRFWSREKYIGCSKPSCYCCSLYMRFHPGNVVLRPAHNSVYVTWIPPLLSRLDKELERKHNLGIMNQMNAYIRRDVKEEIEERIPRRDKAPDSTSGVDIDSLLSL